MRIVKQIIFIGYEIIFRRIMIIAMIIGTLGIVLLFVRMQQKTTGIFPILSISFGKKIKPQLGIGSKQISPKDGMCMVFVPQGYFQMGSNNGPDTEKPLHTVWLDSYWIDRTEVTNAQFEKFTRDTNYKTDAELAGWSYVYDMPSTRWLKVNGANWRHPQGLSSNLDGLENHPVTHISWNDASAYSKWAGRRLPSEAEWEKAARGTDCRIYPWGDKTPDYNLLNFADKNITLDWADKSKNDSYAFTSPVGNYPQGVSPYGALDMAGNVWEWVNDWYDANYYHRQIIWSNPAGPSTAQGRILRGGSWADSARVTRTTFRLAYYPTYWYAYYGFRCAKDARSENK